VQEIRQQFAIRYAHHIWFTDVVFFPYLRVSITK
jgi:hypothetical protein